MCVYSLSPPCLLRRSLFLKPFFFSFFFILLLALIYSSILHPSNFCFHPVAASSKKSAKIRVQEVIKLKEFTTREGKLSHQQSFASGRVLAADSLLAAHGSSKLICRPAEVDGGDNKIKRARLLTDEPSKKNKMSSANANANCRLIWLESGKCH